MSDRMVWYIWQYFVCILRSTKAIHRVNIEGYGMRLLVSEIDVLGLLWKWLSQCQIDGVIHLVILFPKSSPHKTYI